LDCSLPWESPDGGPTQTIWALRKIESLKPQPPTRAITNPAASAPAAATSSTAVPPSQTEDANANSNATPKGEAKPADEAKTTTPIPATPAAPATTVRSSTVRAKKISPAEKLAAKREARAASARASKQTPPAATDSGDADFRKAEGYLYGRGASENCDEAVKYLKAASAKSNAKARSTFGTMYATGHCAPRDLPTSYLWFAMALRADPNNQILEKDLTAVWNQMTPPERQLATRMKQ
jgi:TPR repeat protein